MQQVDALVPASTGIIFSVIYTSTVDLEFAVLILISTHNALGWNFEILQIKLELRMTKALKSL